MVSFLDYLYGDTSKWSIKDWSFVERALEKLFNWYSTGPRPEAYYIDFNRVDHELKCLIKAVLMAMDCKELMESTHYKEIMGLAPLEEKLVISSNPFCMSDAHNYMNIIK